MSRNAFKPITIVGGGLAGLTLGIGLRQQGIPVTVWEAGHYPRHRVCGEFISGRGIGVLDRLGLKNSIIADGAGEARDAVFFFGDNHGPVQTMQPPALSVSRFDLDSSLAARFLKSGGRLLQDSPWRGDFGEGVVRANGRRLKRLENNWRWFGLKAHARNVSLLADLEMHSFPNGYVGICRLQAGQVNVCGLFRRAGSRSGSPSAPVPTDPYVKIEDRARTTSWKAILSGPSGTALHSRLAQAVFDEDSFCSVAGLDLRPRAATPQSECCIGDALTMTPPITGNGMSMAFEAAELALEPLVSYSGGGLSWSDAQGQVARACDRTFSRRLAWAKILQCVLFSSVIRSTLGWALLNSNFVWRMMLANTR